MTTTLAPPEAPAPAEGPAGHAAPPAPEAPRGRRLSRRLVSGLAAAAVVVVAAGLLISGLGSGDGASVEPGKPQIVSADQLGEFAAEAGRPVFWAGPPAAGFKLELTEIKGGSTFVRYLSSDAAAGDKRANFTTIGTYPSKGAYQSIKAATDRKGTEALDRGDEGLALWYKKAPANVYLAQPDAKSPLVEVYSPRPKDAQQLAETDQVVPVR